MHLPIDFSAPGARGNIPSLEVRLLRLQQRRDQQVRLGVPAQIFDHALRLRIRGFTKIRFETKPRGKRDVLGVRHHDVGDHAGLQAAHPIRQHRGWHTAQFFETLGQQLQGGRPRLVGAEPNEPHSTPGQHGAENVPSGLVGPVERQVLTGHRHPRTIGPPLLLPACLGLGHRPPKVPGRAAVAILLGQRQQPLGRDPSVGSADALRDQRHDCRRIAHARRTRPPADLPGRPPPQHAPDCFCGRAAQCRGAAIRPHQLVGIDNFHLVPQRLHVGVPSRLGMLWSEHLQHASPGWGRLFG